MIPSLSVKDELEIDLVPIYKGWIKNLNSKQKCCDSACIRTRQED